MKIVLAHVEVFWLRQDLKKCKCPYVRLSEAKCSRAHNLTLFGSNYLKMTSRWLQHDYSMTSALLQDDFRSLRQPSEAGCSIGPAGYIVVAHVILVPPQVPWTWTWAWKYLGLHKNWPFVCRSWKWKDNKSNTVNFIKLCLDKQWNSIGKGFDWKFYCPFCIIKWM